MKPAWLRLTLALFWILSLLLPMRDAAAGDAPAPQPTRVVVLGVDHSVQLVSEADRPGLLAAFIERVAPDAVCIERSPAQFARGDLYEFTYEVQGVVLPYARTHRLEVCPIDWVPSREDELLGWGMEFSQPPEIRRAEGFQGFLAFPEPSTLRRGLFHAEDRAALAKIHAWIDEVPEKLSRDLPRRMFLYRTFMQARLVARAAKAHPGGTVLVVVGEFHKHQIEDILADDPAIEIVPPASFGLPDRAAADRNTTREHRIAIASFNLLGAQAATGNVDLTWVGRVLDALEREREDAETRLLRTRHDLLAGSIDRAEAIARYRAIAGDAGARRAFTWDGVLDRTRVDSYFDPFGNLRIDQRARVELARELSREGATDEAERLHAALRAELTPRQARQFDAYWQRDIASPPPG